MYQSTPDGLAAGAIGGTAGWFCFDFLDGDTADIEFGKKKTKKKTKENKKKN
jgi:hypothetical protein